MLGLEETTGLVLWDKPYKGSVTPTSLVDRSRWGNNGTHANITMVQLDSGLWVRDFNNTSSRVTLGSIISFADTEPHSASWWAYDENPVTSMNEVFGRTAGSSSVRLYDSSGTMRLYIFNTAGASVWRTVANTSRNAWHHYCYTIDSARLCIAYGDADGVAGVTMASSAYNHEVIGYAAGTGGYFDGKIALTKIFNFALTPAQIRAIFQKERVYFGV